MFGAETDEVKSVSVKEGESVTLNPDLTQIQNINKIEWRWRSLELKGQSLLKL